jgi:hypothetical protein
MTPIENLLFGGLEGSSKSVSGNKLAIKIATRYEPVLFAYRDYELLRENRRKLIEDFGVDEKEICVCGTSKINPEALASYTNPEKPRYMEAKAKYIMCSQAVLQRNKHLKFWSAGDHKKKIWSNYC